MSLLEELEKDVKEENTEKKNSILTNVVDDSVRMEIDAELSENLDKVLEVLFDNKVEYGSKLEALANLQAILLKPLMNEMTRVLPNEGRIKAVEKTSAALGNLLKILDAKKKNEIKDELDPNSKKFQLAFGWFFEMVLEVIQELDVDEIFLNNLISNLSDRLFGWEEKLTKNLKGVGMKALERKQIENPFLNKIRGIEEKLEDD